jgi:hypothetical protein
LWIVVTLWFSGFSIDGFHHNGSKVEALEIDQISELLHVSLVNYILTFSN